MDYEQQGKRDANTKQPRGEPTAQSSADRVQLRKAAADGYEAQRSLLSPVVQLKPGDETKVADTDLKNMGGPIVKPGDVYVVTDPKAYIRDAAKLKSTGKLIPKGSRVVIREVKTTNKGTYVRVAEVTKTNNVGKEWGWTARSNLSTQKEVASKNEVEAIDFNRTHVPAFDPAWIQALQNTLKVPAKRCTGSFNRETVRAIASFQKSTGVKGDPTGKLTKATLAAIAKAHTTLPKATVGTYKMDGKVSYMGTTKPNDYVEKGVKAGGYASWKAFKGEWQSIMFLGKRLRGHPLLLQRVAVARQYLIQKIGSKLDPTLSVDQKDAKIGQMVGCNEGHKDLRNKGTSYHTFGWALDVNYQENPWVGGNPDAPKSNATSLAVIAHANKLMGTGGNIKPSETAKMAKSKTTEEMWEYFNESSQALEAYLKLKGDKTAIEAQIKAVGNLKGKEATAAHWLTQIATDDKNLRARGSNWQMGGAGQRKDRGFMNLHKEIVVALRDAAGLSWGGCDLGSQSGDFMHFDCRTLPKASRIRAVAAAERRKAKKAAKAKSNAKTKP